jgi:predicted phage tail protein
VKIALLLLVPVMLFSAWQFARREENENRLALVASAVALRDVDVSCPGFWTRMVEITPNAGWVDFDAHGRPSDHTNLSASTCKSLERVWRGKQRSFACLLSGGCDEGTLRAVHGIVTLAHESWHLRGVVDEARAQCYAVQTIEPVAGALGVAPVEARTIALRVAADDAAAPPGEYHSPECRPGGVHDLHPATPDWPTG